MRSTPKILNSTKPVLYETGYADWPYAFAGSCFPIRWGRKLYIVSAYHCYENHQVKPEDTLYPLPEDDRRFLGFCSKTRGKDRESLDSKHHDQIVIEVCANLHPARELESVEAIDVSKPNGTISLDDPSLKDVWLRGYMFANPEHKIDYEEGKISQQAYVTNGVVSSRRSLFEHCHMLKVKTPCPKACSPKGMSGSPVYGEDSDGNVKYAGTVIEFNSHTDEYLIIDFSILVETLRSANA